MEISVGKQNLNCQSREALTSSRNFINCIMRAKGRREKDGESEGEIKSRNMAGGRSVMWLGRELTLTIYLFACLAFGNHKTNTLNEAKHAARADFFEQTKIKSWRCHNKQREEMDCSTCNIN